MLSGSRPSPLPLLPNVNGGVGSVPFRLGPVGLGYPSVLRHRCGFAARFHSARVTGLTHRAPPAFPTTRTHGDNDLRSIRNTMKAEKREKRRAEKAVTEEKTAALEVRMRGSGGGLRMRGSGAPNAGITGEGGILPRGGVY